MQAARAGAQGRGSVQSNGWARQIESTTRQNAALVEQLAAARRLSGQAARLNDLVQRFRVAA